MDARVSFDVSVGATFLRYARLVAGRGYVHNTLGNMAMRVPAEGFVHGVAYTKHAEISLDFPFIHGKPAYYVPADVDVEAGARRIETFIADTNCLVLIGHGVTTLGRTISEAYHRLTSFTSEVRRNIAAEELAALESTRVQYRSKDDVERTYRLAEQVIYPERAQDVMSEGDEET